MEQVPMPSVRLTVALEVDAVERGHFQLLMAMSGSGSTAVKSTDAGIISRRNSFFRYA